MVLSLMGAEAGRAPRGYSVVQAGMLVAWVRVAAGEEVRSGEIWGVVWKLRCGVCWLIDSFNKYLSGANYMPTPVLIWRPNQYLLVVELANSTYTCELGFCLLCALPNSSGEKAGMDEPVFLHLWDGHKDVIKESKVKRIQWDNRCKCFLASAQHILSAQ